MTTSHGLATVLVIFNAMSAFAYACVLLALHAAEWRLTAQMKSLAAPAVWDMREGALLAALLVGGGISPILFQCFGKRRFIVTERRWLSAAALGAGFGCAAVVLACALTPGVMGLGALAADSPSAARALRAAVAPVSLLVLAPAGLAVAPYFLIVGLPIVLPGGAFNALVCLSVLRRHHRRAV